MSQQYNWDHLSVLLDFRKRLNNRVGFKQRLVVLFAKGCCGDDEEFFS